MAVSLTVEKVGEFMSGTAVVTHSVSETITVPLTFNGATASLEISWSVGQENKFVSFPTVTTLWTSQTARSRCLSRPIRRNTSTSQARSPPSFHGCETTTSHGQSFWRRITPFAPPW